VKTMTGWLHETDRTHVVRS